jgi:hypothetical protein
MVANWKLYIMRLETERLMTDDRLTTIQIDVETRDRLKTLAVAYERTAAGQLRWLVNQEYEKLAKVELLPKGADGKQVKSNAKS